MPTSIYLFSIDQLFVDLAPQAAVDWSVPQLTDPFIRDQLQRALFANCGAL
ncbi:hypothetical protein T4D_16810 [Trichinella pseudospiralis]|uniref:Uncharacterized protein n=1 Tax=Trichinella pseudospiralis TaxID=6337 RepID=A0A0V1FCL9_TRIPS|nr:hypothetical protein T4D_16810 [Trichinella pseudospiralis]